MTDERAKLLERLRPTHLIVDQWLQSMNQAADQIEADGKRIAELESWKAAEDARHHILALQRDEARAQFDNHVAWASDRIAELEAFQQKAIKQVCELAREAGEAKGKLEGSEMPGIVDGWREKCERLEARVAELGAKVQDLMDELAYHGVYPNPIALKEPGDG